MSSQVTKTDTTNPSRRALLAGAPALAAAAMAGGTIANAVAIAEAKAAEIDPIFAAIAAHRAAVLDYLAPVIRQTASAPMRTWWTKRAGQLPMPSPR